MPYHTIPYHIACSSWGAVFFPKPWKEFIDYMIVRLEQDTASNSFLRSSIKVIPHSATNGWKQVRFRTVNAA